MTKVGPDLGRCQASYFFAETGRWCSWYRCTSRKPHVYIYIHLFSIYIYISNIYIYLKYIYIYQYLYVYFIYYIILYYIVLYHIILYYIILYYFILYYIFCYISFYLLLYIVIYHLWHLLACSVPTAMADVTAGSRVEWNMEKAFGDR